jgi:hypothetical protein
MSEAISEGRWAGEQTKFHENTRFCLKNFKSLLELVLNGTTDGSSAPPSLRSMVAAGIKLNKGTLKRDALMARRILT